MVCGVSLYFAMKTCGMTWCCQYHVLFVNNKCGSVMICHCLLTVEYMIFLHIVAVQECWLYLFLSVGLTVYCFHNCYYLLSLISPVLILPIITCLIVRAYFNFLFAAIITAIQQK